MAQEKGSATHGPGSSGALRALVIGLLGVLLYVAHEAFIPIALAVLFALVLSSPVEWLHSRGLPRGAGALLIVAILLGLLATVVNTLWEPAQHWLADAPRALKTVEQKLRPASRVIRSIGAVTDSAEKLTDAAASPGKTPVQIVPVVAKASPSLMVATRSVAIAATTIIILVLFLLASGPPVLARMSTALASDLRAAHVLKVIGSVRHEVGRYYATIAMINVGLGAATWLIMRALGMPNPMLWGVMAGVLNFVPYAGSAVTLVVLAVIASVSFDGLGKALAVAGCYLGLATLEGQVVQPLLVGRRLEINPLIVLLALWFAGWFWGVAGILMAVPTLVAIKVAAEHSQTGAPLVQFLSPGHATNARSLHSTQDR